MESALHYWSNGLLDGMVFSGTSIKKAGPQDVNPVDLSGNPSETGAYVARAWKNAVATGEYRYEANGKGLIIRVRETGPDGEPQRRDLNIDSIRSGTLTPPVGRMRAEGTPEGMHHTYDMPAVF